MKITVKGSIEEIAKEIFKIIPLDKRIDLATRMHETAPFKTEYPSQASFYSVGTYAGCGLEHTPRIDLVGPFDRVPSAYVALDYDESKKLKSSHQSQLVFLDRFIVDRCLLGRHDGKVQIYNRAVYSGSKVEDKPLIRYMLEESLKDKPCSNYKILFGPENRDLIVEAMEDVGLEEVEGK